MPKNCLFRYSPLMPTKGAWQNRPFTEYRSETTFYSAILSHEKSLGKFNYIGGYIHFKNGFYSTYKDGSEPPSRANPKWWNTGAQKCRLGCCINETEICNSEAAIITPTPYMRSLQEFRRIDGMGGLIDQLGQITDKSQIAMIQFNGIGSFYVDC